METGRSEGRGVVVGRAEAELPRLTDGWSGTDDTLGWVRSVGTG